MRKHTCGLYWPGSTVRYTVISTAFVGGTPAPFSWLGLQLILLANLLTACSPLQLAWILLRFFDRVWHEDLLYRLASSPLPRQLFRLFISFLTGRRFSVFVGTDQFLGRSPSSDISITYICYMTSVALYVDDALSMAPLIRLRQSCIYIQRDQLHLEWLWSYSSVLTIQSDRLWWNNLETLLTWRLSAMVAGPRALLDINFRRTYTSPTLLTC
ncbi:hypothetical protein J6590_078456 [Homalodisca vitripennis]|nr:hypothetical protein J6590_078456 [Homalodisca vitripennis]